ncbi:MAG: DUF5684 domain-containing protein [Ignavibacteria bacterium]|jgi:uncharacterized membrane protein YhaH (DUF805 family)
MLLSILTFLFFFQRDEEVAGGAAVVMGIIMFLIYAAIIIVMIAGMWKIFVKAGKPGWAAIIPIYNIIVLLEIVGRPMWWILIYLICSPVAAIVISLDLAKSFGKDIGYGIGLIIIPIVFYPMLGFGSATYVGPSAAQNKPQA